jgi:hypothetical protein
VNESALSDLPRTCEISRLDLRNLTDEELLAYWNLWLEQAQITNDQDKYTYSHGVFRVEPTDKDRPKAH